MSLPRSTLARCFWRSFFLQAAWNRRGMQNLGFAYAIEPALRVLYPDQERYEQALGRHLGFFNCHPYMAAALLGGAIHHEERISRGEESEGTSTSYKSALQGPIAAVGDGFFWTALRPFFGAAAGLGALLFGWPAVVVVIAVFNLVHLALRLGLFRAGYRQGDAVVGAIGRLGLPVIAERLRVGAAALCGFAAVALATTPRVATASRYSTEAIAIVAAGLGYLALASGLRVYPAIYAFIAAGVGAAWMIGRFQGVF